MAQIFFNQIPLSDPDLNNYDRGVEQWHNANEVNVPTEGINTPRLNVYWRFPATRLQNADGSNNWSYFDNLLTTAIARKQRVRIGFMTAYPGGTTNEGLAAFDGGYACYPLHVHQKMQAEPVKDWRAGNAWTPNYNSPAYHAWLLDLHKKLYQHIVEKGWLHIMKGIDIRGYGSWGEWNSSGISGINHTDDYPTGTFPTTASLKKIVDAHRDGFPNIRCYAMIAGFDAHWLGIVNNPPEIAHYLLTQKNNYGLFGWCRDQWGSPEQYLKDYLENNNRGFAEIANFKVPIMDRWKFADITGEPAPFSNDMADLERQIRLYHASSFGNGNYGNTPNSTVKARVRAASKAAGYRYIVSKADIPAVNGRTLIIKMDWQNVGIAPVYYKDWVVTFEIVNSAGSVVATLKSLKQLYLFGPAPAPETFTDTLTIPATVPAGNYSLRFDVRDGNGYMTNMKLGIQGGDANGKFSLGSIQVGSTPPPVNQGPRANAGGDIEITLPVDSVVLQGSGTDPDGPSNELTYLWAIVSGSGVINDKTSPITQLTALKAGTTVARLTVKDKPGASHFDDVSVKVNAAPAPPVGKKVVKVTPVIEHSIVTYDDGSTEVFDA